MSKVNIPEFICLDCETSVKQIKKTKLKWIPQYCEECYKKRNYSFCMFMQDDVQCIFKKRPGIPYCAKHEHMYDSDEEVEPPKAYTKPNAPKNDQKNNSSNKHTNKLKKAKDDVLVAAYATLECDPSITVSELKNIYHIKSLLHHPDKNLGHLGASTKRMQEINSAYNLVLKTIIDKTKTIYHV
jgi:hypothetical protein